MITGFYAGILALLYFKISLEVVKARRKHRVNLGMGRNHEIAEIVSAHGNFSSYVPILLIMTFLLENTNLIPSWGIHIIAATYTAGRFFHFSAFMVKKTNHKIRKPSMYMTLWPMIILAVLNIFAFGKELLTQGI